MSDLEKFVGFRLWRDQDAELRCTLFEAGKMTELDPSEKDFDRPLGFYNVKMEPVPDPAGDKDDE